MTFTIDNSPDPNAGVGVDSNRFIDIDPAPNWYGSTSVRIKVTDPEGASDTDTLQVTVNPVNDVPWIAPEIPDQSADEDEAISIDLTAYEHDVESSGADLDWTVSGVDHCTVTGENSADDVLTFTPAPDFYGSDAVVLTLADPHGGSTDQSVTLTWTGVNDAPTIGGLPNRELDEDDSLDNAIDLWAYTSDAETADSGLTFTIDNTPDSNAGVSVDSNRLIDIDPAPNWYGSTQVCIKVTDPEGAFDTDTFQVTVNPVNDVPWISPEVPDQSTNEDVPILIDLTAYEHDVESSDTDLDWTVSGADHCTVTGENSADDVLTFTPAPDFYGADVVVLTLSDSHGGSASQSMTLTWTGVNDAPTIGGLPDQSLDEDDSLDDAIDLWAYTSDAETADSGLTFTIDNTPDLNAGVGIDSNRYIDIDPAADWYGSTPVRIKVEDPAGASGTDTFQVTANPVNDVPWISPEVPDQSTNEDVPILIDLTAYEHDVESSDTDLDWIVSGADHCTVSGESSDDDVLTFTPAPNFYGADVVVLTLSDSHGGSASQSMTLTWAGVNDAPTISGLLDQSLDEDDSLDNAIDLWAYTSDAETADSELTFIIDNAPDSNAGVGIDSNRYIDIDPAADWYGSTPVRIKVEDPAGASGTDTFQVTVDPVNDAPWIDPDVPDQAADEDEAISIDLSAHEHDVESTDTALDWTVSGADHCTVTGERSDGDVLTFTPAPDFCGTDLIMLTLADAGGASVSQPLTLTWRAVNDMPWIDPAVPDQSTDEDTTISIDLSAHEHDVESSGMALDWTVSGEEHCTVSGENSDDDRLAFAPEADFYGTDAITLTLTDAGGMSTSQALTLTWRAVNDAPRIDPEVPDQTADEDEAISVDLGAHEHDVESSDTALDWAASGADHCTVSGENSDDDMLTFTPAPDFYGADVITLTLTDGEGASTSQPVTLIWASVNDGPTIDGLPDQNLNEEDSLDEAIDLWAYASDVETADSGLTFTIENSPDPDTGVSIDSNRYIDISPVPDWRGTASVCVRVEDPESASDTDTFLVTAGSYIYLPLVTRNRY